jgi:hypothetical protein
MKALKKVTQKLYHYVDGEKILGKKSNMTGDCSNLSGDFTYLRGDCTSLSGNCSYLRGDCTGLKGNLSDITVRPANLQDHIEG